MRKFVLLIMIVLSAGALALAQNKRISGTVKGVDGKPIAGATVLVEGTSIGTTTNAEGPLFRSGSRRRDAGRFVHRLCLEECEHRGENAPRHRAEGRYACHRRRDRRRLRYGQEGVVHGFRRRRQGRGAGTPQGFQCHQGAGRSGSGRAGHFRLRTARIGHDGRHPRLRLDQRFIDAALRRGRHSLRRRSSRPSTPTTSPASAS